MKAAQLLHLPAGSKTPDIAGTVILLLSNEEAQLVAEAMAAFAAANKRRTKFLKLNKEFQECVECY